MHRPAWIHGPGRDLALALCWVPFAVAVLAVQGHRHLLAAALSGVLLLSLSHQPVTLALVYGDRERFRDHRGIYVAATTTAGISSTVASGRKRVSSVIPRRLTSPRSTWAR